MFLVLFICIYLLELLLAVLDTIKGILKKSMCNIIFVLSGVIFSFSFFFFDLFKREGMSDSHTGSWTVFTRNSEEQRRSYR